MASRPTIALSTSQAAVVLGVSRKTTHRMCQPGGTLPDGWVADKEHRPQGERWVMHVPADDPRLGRLTGAPETSQPPDRGDQDVPGGGTDGGDTQGSIAPGPAGDGPYSEPRLTVPEVRDALIAPLVARLADVDRAATTRWEMIATQRETIGRLGAELDAALGDAATRDRRIIDLQASATAHRELADELRQIIAIERETRQVAQAHLVLAEARIADLEAALRSRPWWRRWLGLAPGG